MSNTSKQRKAIAAARVALGQGNSGSEHEAFTAATLAGRLAFDAGMQLGDLDTAVGSLSATPMWSTVVDGWYDAKEATEVQEADVQAALFTLKLGGQASTLDRQKAYVLVEQMWATIKASR